MYNTLIQELSLLEDDAKVFKLLGPVLVPQDIVEAKSNVDKRIEFINGELYVLFKPCRFC